MLKFVIKEIIIPIKIGIKKAKWKKLHPESDTIPMNIFDFSRVVIGKWSYGELNVAPKTTSPCPNLS